MASDGSTTVWRVQDPQGRGPFKPGLSDRWCDPDGHDFPPVQAEFGLDWLKEIPKGWAVGCAFRDRAGAERWFSPSERWRLLRLGYYLVTLIGCTVIRESATQMIVARPMPLKERIRPQHWSVLNRSAKLDPWRFAA